MGWGVVPWGTAVPHLPTPPHKGEGRHRGHAIGEPMRPTKFGVSQGLTRKEDDVLIRGNGRYVADVAPAGALHAVLLRSPHAHARFRITDITGARSASGVHLVLTSADVADLGDLPCVAI